MQAHPKFKKTILCALLGFMAGAPASRVAALEFAQMPEGQLSLTPAPNVILSFDNSTSMSNEGVSEGDPTSPSNPAKMDVLKSTLQEIFSDTSFLPDGKIRLGWQAMWQVGIWPNNPDVHADKGSQVNNLRVLDAEQRANFLSFLNDSLEVPHCKIPPLPATRSTFNRPAHRMFRQVYTYMNNQSRDQNSPWAGTPGVSAEPWLSCRRAYHIFLTGGKWNRNTSSDCPAGGPLNDCINEFFPLGGNDKKAPTYSNAGSYPTRTLPDGTVYNPTQSNVSIYIDMASDDAVPLADWAFISWATNLSGLGNGVVPTDEYKNAPPTATVTGYSGDLSGRAVVEKYWNPKYDPATWQHLSTYVIGYGQDPTEWNSNLVTNNPPTKGYPTSMLPFGWDGIYPWFWINVKWPLAEAYTWPGTATYYEDPGPRPPSDAALDLWHTAINGRGRFYAVKKNEDLKLAFKEILQTISDESSNGVAGISASSSANVYDKVGLFTAGYDATRAWAGYVYADQYNIDGTITANTGWGATGGTGFGGQQTTADKLDALTGVASRVILTTRDDAGKTPVAFRWAADETYLSTAQKNLLGSEQVLNFLRGDRTQETSAKPAGTLRPRQSRQGDIVNSGVWYVGAPASGYSGSSYQTFRRDKATRAPMLYAGGNDGMLHAFSAADGSEKLAYVPMGLMDKLARLADPGYSHAYYVDNTPFSGDVDLGQGSAAANWQTLLVGTLGAGARGYFVLNITNPGAFGTANAADVVVLDKTGSGAATPPEGSDDNDIGYIFSPPVLDDVNPFVTTQVTRMNDGRWAVILGNGYNSVNQRPVLLIQYLDGDKALKTIAATVPARAARSALYYSGNPAPNGLSAPRVVDLNGDGTADVVYAGDLRGNMWKFDVTSANPAQWQVAFSGNPLYTAVSGAGRRAAAQPIFAPPTVKPNDRGAGGMMVAFGTGANLTVADRTNANTQTIYSVLDNTRYEPDPNSTGKLRIIATARGTPNSPGYIPAPAAVGSGVSMLRQQTVGGSSAGSGTSDGQTYWGIQASSIDWATQKGWYLNLPEQGERLLKPMPFYDGSNILAVFTQVPAAGAASEESCTGTMTAALQYLTLLNIMDGKPPSISVMDRNGDGKYDATDGFVARTTLAPGATSMVGSRWFTTVFSGGVKGGPGTKKEVLRNMPETAVRPSWRQM